MGKSSTSCISFTGYPFIIFLNQNQKCEGDKSVINEDLLPLWGESYTLSLVNVHDIPINPNNTIVTLSFLQIHVPTIMKKLSISCLDIRDES